MRKLRLTAASALLAVPASVWADSGVGVDTSLANKLDPSGGQATKPLDPDGTSWLEPGQHRSPHVCRPQFIVALHTRKH